MSISRFQDKAGIFRYWDKDLQVFESERHHGLDLKHAEKISTELLQSSSCSRGWEQFLLGGEPNCRTSEPTLDPAEPHRNPSVSAGLTEVDKPVLQEQIFLYMQIVLHQPQRGDPSALVRFLKIYITRLDSVNLFLHLIRLLIICWNLKPI